MDTTIDTTEMFLYYLCHNQFSIELTDKPYEEFWIILLNRANKVISKCQISEGGISGTVVDPKKIFKVALDNHASSLILGHYVK